MRCALAKRAETNLASGIKDTPTEFTPEQRAEDRKLLPLIEEPTMLQEKSLLGSMGVPGVTSGLMRSLDRTGDR